MANIVQIRVKGLLKPVHQKLGAKTCAMAVDSQGYVASKDGGFCSGKVMDSLMNTITGQAQRLEKIRLRRMRKSRKMRSEATKTEVIR